MSEEITLERAQKLKLFELMCTPTTALNLSETARAYLDFTKFQYVGDMLGVEDYQSLFLPPDNPGSSVGVNVVHKIQEAIYHQFKALGGNHLSDWVHSSNEGKRFRLDLETSDELWSAFFEFKREEEEASTLANRLDFSWQGPLPSWGEIRATMSRLNNDLRSFEALQRGAFMPFVKGEVDMDGLRRRIREYQAIQRMWEELNPEMKDSYDPHLLVKLLYVLKAVAVKRAEETPMEG